MSTINLDSVNQTTNSDSDDNSTYIQQEINKNLISDETTDVYESDSANNVSIKSVYQVNKNADLVTDKPSANTDTAEKYGDASKYEAAGDNYIFFPVANKLVTSMNDLGLTPNMVTYLSTASTLLSVYYIVNNNTKYAAIAYSIGYLLDCVDGKMARKYNMTSKYGMVLDLVSDNVTNIILIAVLIYKYGVFNWFMPCILIMTYMISLSYGLNEAIASYKATGSDNFLNRRELELGKSNNILDNLFLLITGISYNTYKNLFPEYDEKKIEKWLATIKEFGPGNYTLFMIFVILNLPEVNETVVVL